MQMNLNASLTRYQDPVFKTFSQSVFSETPFDNLMIKSTFLCVLSLKIITKKVKPRVTRIFSND